MNALLTPTVQTAFAQILKRDGEWAKFTKDQLASRQLYPNLAMWWHARLKLVVLLIRQSRNNFDDSYPPSFSFNETSLEYLRRVHRGGDAACFVGTVDSYSPGSAILDIVDIRELDRRLEGAHMLTGDDGGRYWWLDEHLQPNYGGFTMIRDEPPF